MNATKTCTPKQLWPSKITSREHVINNVWYSWSSLQKIPTTIGLFNINLPLDFPFESKDMTSRSLKILVSYVAAALNVFAFSNMISSGIPLRATNLRGQQMNSWIVRLGVSSKYMILVLPQVNKQMYSLLTWISFPKTVFTNNGPAKSTLMLTKGYPSLNRNSDISDDGSTWYDLPSCLLHTTQL